MAIWWHYCYVSKLFKDHLKKVVKWRWCWCLMWPELNIPPRVASSVRSSCRYSTNSHYYSDICLCSECCQVEHSSPCMPSTVCPYCWFVGPPCASCLIQSQGVEAQTCSISVGDANPYPPHPPLELRAGCGRASWHSWWLTGDTDLLICIMFIYLNVEKLHIDALKYFDLITWLLCKLLLVRCFVSY